MEIPKKISTVTDLPQDITFREDALNDKLIQVGERFYNVSIPCKPPHSSDSTHETVAAECEDTKTKLAYVDDDSGLFYVQNQSGSYDVYEAPTEHSLLERAQVAFQCGNVFDEKWRTYIQDGLNGSNDQTVLDGVLECEEQVDFPVVEEVEVQLDSQAMYEIATDVDASDEARMRAGYNVIKITADDPEYLTTIADAEHGFHFKVRIDAATIHLNNIDKKNLAALITFIKDEKMPVYVREEACSILVKSHPLEGIPILREIIFNVPLNSTLRETAKSLWLESSLPPISFMDEGFKDKLLECLNDQEIIAMAKEDPVVKKLRGEIEGKYIDFIEDDLDKLRDFFNSPDLIVQRDKLSGYISNAASGNAEAMLEIAMSSKHMQHLRVNASLGLVYLNEAFCIEACTEIIKDPSMDAKYRASCMEALVLLGEVATVKTALHVQAQEVKRSKDLLAVAIILEEDYWQMQTLLSGNISKYTHEFLYNVKYSLEEIYPDNDLKKMAVWKRILPHMNFFTETGSHNYVQEKIEQLENKQNAMQVIEFG
jgi:hypothetical protein